MRKVKFKKWIPLQYSEEPIISTNLNRPILISKGVRKEGTNCWEEDFIHDGLFHQWGTSFIEEAEHNVPYTTALIEVEDGTIIEVYPFNIKFID